MKRRLLLAGSLAGGATLLADRLHPEAAGRLLEPLRRGLDGDAPAPALHRPGLEAGHRLRDAGALPDPAALPLAGETGVLIAGSGAGGLSCAWALRQAGRDDLLLLEGPVPSGNCAHGEGAAGPYPLAAHYLPLPDRRSMHLRHLLADAGVLLEGLHDAAPLYDEAAVVHAPVERVHVDGRWHEGLLPPLDAEGERQWQRFLARLALEQAAPGRYGFPRPPGVEHDPAARALDARAFAHWLDAEGLHHPALRWYLDYACRDDYGIDSRGISAWAGLNYFCGRQGQGRGLHEGAVLTWPAGLGRLASHMRHRIGGGHIRAGSLLRCAPAVAGWHELLLQAADGGLQRWRARRVVLACPLHVARRVAPWAWEGLESAPGPSISPWLVANLRLNRFPVEAPGAELAWDNVVAGSEALGYVVSTHQAIRVARPARTVFSCYRALGQPDPQAQSARRRELLQAGPDELLALATQDLDTVYGRGWRRHCEAVELTLHGHAMASPTPGHLDEPLAARARAAVREGRGLLHAHADLSGCSVFEEASAWGLRSAEALLGEAGRWTAAGDRA